MSTPKDSGPLPFGPGRLLHLQFAAVLLDELHQKRADRETAAGPLRAPKRSRLQQFQGFWGESRGRTGRV